MCLSVCVGGVIANKLAACSGFPAEADPSQFFLAFIKYKSVGDGRESIPSRSHPLL